MLIGIRIWPRWKNPRDLSGYWIKSKRLPIMDAIGNSELEVKVRAVDANLVMEGFQKIANRISTEIILAALIIGTLLLIQVETPFQLFGYPGLAILCFLATASGGFWLVIGIFIQDKKSNKKSFR